VTAKAQAQATNQQRQQTLRLFLQQVPDRVKTKLFVRIFNHLARGQTLVERLRELDNRIIGLRITDIPCLFQLHVLNGRLRAADQDCCDVTISGELQGFLQLAALNEDPDTLFFQRVLRIDGETDTGVHIKNILDAMDYDWDAHIDAVLAATPWLAKGAKRCLHASRRLIPREIRQGMAILNL
jgi:predicted lipid carrier protein YhbT